MATAVVTKATGGLPVVDVTATKPALGVSVTEAAGGIAVTKVSLAVGGLPVTFVLAGNEWPAGGGGGTGDPQWDNVKLLMGFNGANNATSGVAFSDESSVSHGIASTNDVFIKTDQSVFGGSSVLANGTVTQVSFPDHIDYSLSNVPFTVECWIRPLAVSGGAVHFIVGQWHATPNLGWSFNQLDTVLRFSVSTTGSDNIVQMSGGTLSANTWHAVCAEFDGTKYRLYINGVMVGSSTTLRTISNSTLKLSIGSTDSLGFIFNGNIDELRLTKGVARYASDAGYTVATSAFPRNGGGGTTYATFDGTPTNVTVSNDGLTATHSSSGVGSVISTEFFSTGKFYFEVVLQTSTTNADSVGVIKSASAVTTANITGVSLGSGSALIYSNGVNTGISLGVSAVGDRYDMAIDLTARQGWIRRNGGNWNGSGTANPATNVGGVTIAATVTFAPYAAFNAGANSNAMTANFGASAFSGAVPSGFTPGWPA